MVYSNPLMFVSQIVSSPSVQRNGIHKSPENDTVTGDTKTFPSYIYIAYVAKEMYKLVLQRVLNPKYLV